MNAETYLATRNFKAPDLPLDPVEMLTKKSHDLSISHFAAMKLVNAASYLNKPCSFTDMTRTIEAAELEIEERRIETEFKGRIVA